jgi:hypothetical protein
MSCVTTEVIGTAVLQGPTAVLGGLAMLVLAWLNWRLIEAHTRSIFGERVARRLATSPVGNKIGGTVFLALMGVLLVVDGLLQML